MDPIAILVGILVTMIGGVGTWVVINHLKKPKSSRLELKKAPANILTRIVPKSSMAQARELLGAPYSEQDEQWSYNFENALFQIRSKNGRSIDSVLLTNPETKRNPKFEIPYTDFKLGEISLANVVQKGTIFKRDTSSKHCLISTECYYGNSGNYWYFTYGIFIGPGADYPHDLINWDYDKQIVSSDLSHAKINFVCISEASTQTYFDFWAFK